MVAQNTVRTYGINHVFRFVMGIWLRQNSRTSSTILLHMYATCSALPSNISTMSNTNIQPVIHLSRNFFFHRKLIWNISEVSPPFCVSRAIKNIHILVRGGGSEIGMHMRTKKGNFPWIMAHEVYNSGVYIQGNNMIHLHNIYAWVYFHGNVSLFLQNWKKNTLFSSRNVKLDRRLHFFLLFVTFFTE